MVCHYELAIILYYICVFVTVHLTAPIRHVHTKCVRAAYLLSSPSDTCKLSPAEGEMSLPQLSINCINLYPLCRPCTCFTHYSATLFCFFKYSDTVLWVLNR